MFIWADNLADSHILITGNLKPHNGRLSIERPLATWEEGRDEGGPGSHFERWQEATLQMPSSPLLGDGQIPLKKEGGDREVKPTNTKQCHRIKLAVIPHPWRYEELWCLAAPTGTTLAEGFPRPGWEAHHWLRPHTQAQSPPSSVATSC